jgi:hypothetical protein
VKAILIMALFAAAVATTAQAGLEDDQAAVAAIVPGRVVNQPWGWSIDSARGQTRVIRLAQGGYAVSGAGGNFKLIPREYGWAIAPANPRETPATWQDVFNAGYARKRR